MSNTAIRNVVPDLREEMAKDIRILREQVIELAHRDRDLHGCEDASGQAAARAFAAKASLDKALNDYFDHSERLEGRAP